MPGETPPPSSFSARRKWSIVFSVLVSILASGAIVAMLNYLATRHVLRLSLSGQARTQLSPQTVGLLKSLTNQVKVVIYYSRKAPLYDYVSSLLEEYRLASSQVSVQTVDYLSDPGAAVKIKETYHLGSVEDKDLVLFECNGRTRQVDGKALGDYDVTQVADDPATGRQFQQKLKAFKGEAAFTAAILSVTKPKPMKAYFLRGHREHDPADDSGREGYSKFNEVLRQNYIATAPLILTGTNTVPADCRLLIIAGPNKDPLARIELEKIKDYLQQGGRMLVCLDLRTESFNTGLEAILAKWGIEVGHELVRDPRQSSDSAAQDIIVSDFNWKHPLMNPMRNSTLHMISPRPVRKLEATNEAPDAPKVDELAFTGENPLLGDHVQPEKHPIPLMASVEKTSVKGVFPERGLTRIVVIGDSYLFVNGVIGAIDDNHEFADRLVNWLLDQTEMLQGVPPRSVDEYKLQMTRTELYSVQWLFLAGMPGGILLLGGLVWLRRRH
jgi:ABC-type uncharacterized transport system